MEAGYGSSQDLYDEALKLINIQRDPVLAEAIKVLKQDEKRSKDYHVYYDDDDFDNLNDDDNDEINDEIDEIDDNDLIDGDYGDDYMGL